VGETGYIEKIIQNKVSKRLKLKKDHKIKLPARLLSDQKYKDSSSHKFILSSIIIEGTKNFKPSDFAPLYISYLAKEITDEDISDLAYLITKKYHNAGYILTDVFVEPQELENGILYLKVVEGIIEKVNFITNNRSFTDKISIYENYFSENQIFHEDQLSRFMTILSHLNAVKVIGTELELIPNTNGHYILNVKVLTDVIEANIYVDNKGTKIAGPLQTWVSVSANSVGIVGDRFSVGAFFTPDSIKDTLYGELSYHVPILKYGTLLKLKVSKSNYNFDSQFLNRKYNNKSFKATAEISHPLFLSAENKFDIFTSFTYANITENESSQGGASSASYKDNVRTISVGINYLHQTTSGYFDLRVEAVKGIDVWDASKVMDSLTLPTSKVGADGLFTKFKFRVHHYVKLTKELSIYSGVKGQYSNKRLLFSEEFTLGGTEFGRGYDYSEISGRHGIGAFAELAYKVNYKFLIFTGYEAYGFVDYGSLWHQTVNELSLKHENLISLGAGVRFDILDRAKLTLEYAKPINKVLYASGSKTGRFFFSMSVKF
jgi:hemolysin activation/secretion protein